jgi:hypothetical protein
VLIGGSILALGTYLSQDGSNDPEGGDKPADPTCEGGDVAACMRDGSYQRACERDHAPGCLAWGQSLETNDRDAALAAYARACSLGLQEACDARLALEPCPADELNRVLRYSKREGYLASETKPHDPPFWQEALAVGREVHAKLPRCVHVTSALAYFLFRVEYNVCANGANVEAMALIKEAGDAAPTDTAVMRNRGRLLAADGQFPAALTAFNEAAARERGNQSREWIYSLEAVFAANEHLLEAARAVVEGRRLTDEDDLAWLSLAELAVVESGLAARHGKLSELQATDWFYFCYTESPLQVSLSMDPEATSKLVRARFDDVDLANSDAINARQKELRDSVP